MYFLFHVVFGFFWGGADLGRAAGQAASGRPRRGEPTGRPAARLHSIPRIASRATVARFKQDAPRPSSAATPKKIILKIKKFKSYEKRCGFRNSNPLRPSRAERQRTEAKAK